MWVVRERCRRGSLAGSDKNKKNATLSAPHTSPPLSSLSLSPGVIQNGGQGGQVKAAGDVGVHGGEVRLVCVEASRGEENEEACAFIDCFFYFSIHPFASLSHASSTAIQRRPRPRRHPPALRHPHPQHARRPARQGCRITRVVALRRKGQEGESRQWRGGGAQEGGAASPPPPPPPPSHSRISGQGGRRPSAKGGSPGMSARRADPAAAAARAARAAAAGWPGAGAAATLCTNARGPAPPLPPPSKSTPRRARASMLPRMSREAAPAARAQAARAAACAAARPGAAGDRWWRTAQPSASRPYSWAGPATAAGPSLTASRPRQGRRSGEWRRPREGRARLVMRRSAWKGRGRKKGEGRGGEKERG